MVSWRHIGPHSLTLSPAARCRLLLKRQPSDPGPWLRHLLVCIKEKVPTVISVLAVLAVLSVLSVLSLVAIIAVVATLAMLGVQSMLVVLVVL